MDDLFARRERERQSADRQYNDALTALDRALQAKPDLPSQPRPYDDSQVERLNLGWKKVPPEGPAVDRSLRGRLRGFIWRFLAPTFEAQERFNAAIVDHINRNLAAHAQAHRAATALVEAMRGEMEAIARFEWLLIQFLQTITGYVDTKDRSTGGNETREQVALIQRRLVMVERELARAIENRAGVGSLTAVAREVPMVPAMAVAPAPFADLASVKYLGFEDRFRGPTADISARLEPYVPMFASASDVLDVGCGRGELLELLRKHGIKAHGIDANQAMVDLCVSRGLAAERADALAYLEGQDDGSFGGMIAIQVVEHFEPAYLMRVLEAAHRTLRPGAPLVLETINPACWMAFFECYIRDITHARPLHPDTLRYLVQASGFTSVNVEYRQPVGEGDRLERVAAPASEGPLAAIAAVVNAHADKLNDRLFSSMDYAVIARR